MSELSVKLKKNCIKTISHSTQKLDFKVIRPNFIHHFILILIYIVDEWISPKISFWCFWRSSSDISSIKGQKTFSPWTFWKNDFENLSLLSYFFKIVEICWINNGYGMKEMFSKFFSYGFARIINSQEYFW